MLRSVVNKFFLNTVLITLISVIILGAFWVYFEIKIFSREEQQLRQEYITVNENQIRGEAERALVYINSSRSRAEVRKEQVTKQRVINAYTIAMNLYMINKDSKSNKEIQELIKNTFMNLRYRQGHSYFFIFDQDGVAIMNSAYPDIEGKQFDTVKDSHIMNVYPLIRAKVMDKNEGFVSYRWKKPGISKGYYEKLSYVKLFEPFNWIIGTGEYDDENEKEQQQEILAYLEKIKFGKDGYLFAGRWDGLSLLGPAKGRNMYEVADINNLKIVQELIKAAKDGGGFVQYVMPDIDGKRPLTKLSYSIPVEDWEWYIGAGIYLSDVEKIISSNKAMLKDNLTKTLIIIIFVALLVFTTAVFIVYALSRRMNRELTVFGTFFEQASMHADPELIDTSHLTFSEFFNLAESANQMINDRREARAALYKNEELLRATLYSTADGILVVDSNEKVLVKNPSFAKMWNIPHELLERTDNDWDLINYVLEQLEDPEAFTKRVQEFYQTTKESLEEIRLKDGRIFERFSYPLIRQDTIIGRVWSFRDISRRKKAEAEQERLESQLRQVQKLEAVGQLAGGIAHDFNNLLQAIHGYTDLAMQELDPDSSARENLEQAMKAVLRSGTLVRQLLTFSRKDRINPEVLNLNDLIGGLMKMVGRLIGEHIELRVIPGHYLNNIHADPGQIEQILMNLCVNARDAMAQGGQIIIETRNVYLDKEYCINHSWAEEGEYVSFSIADTGEGIPDNVREHIFEPFYTTKEVGEGTGLGLATVYGIVKQHSGLINVYSEMGHGTIFKIYLPAVEEETSKTKIEGKIVNYTSGSETILLAEDEVQVRELSVKVLERAGYNIIVAEDGESAVELFREHTDEIDLAILDVIMPKKSGSMVSEFIWKIKPELPVIFCSGYSKNYLGTDFEPKKNVRLLQKPLSSDDILRTIRELLENNSS
jgi:PAS domain S-box-containing protein